MGNPGQEDYSYSEKIRGLYWLIGGGTANGIFCQLTVFGSLFILFLGELGLGKTQIGALMSLFPFCGLVALFVAHWTARFGVKRAFVTFFGIRKMVTALLLFVPLILAHFGPRVTFSYIAGILLTFAICRAIAETAYLSWEQEIVPFEIRGKYSAVSNILPVGAGALSLAAASYVIGHGAGLGRYLGLMAAGVVFGLVSVALHCFVPGGKPVPNDDGEARQNLRVIKPPRSRDLWMYLLGTGLVTLAGSGLGPFLPLFMKEQVGLTPNLILLTQTAALVTGVVCFFPWGWAADRYGGKPVLLAALLITSLAPVGWMFIPQAAPWNLYASVAVIVFAGVASTGMIVGAMRLLYVSVVPPAQRTEYMATYYAWMGVTGGVAPLLGGRLLDTFQGLAGKLSIFTINPYTPLFLAGIVLPAAAMLLFRRVTADASTGELRAAARQSPNNSR